MTGTADLTAVLRRNRVLFHPVVEYNAATDVLLPLDFTAANKSLNADILEDTGKFTAYIEAVLLQAGARYGIGGYAEHRTVYQVSRVFDGPNPGDEPRRLHLGIDIWGPAGTPVMAPLEGTVHSVAFNDRFGDYGTTIILSHLLEGVLFHTLYGHLGLASIRHIKAGDLLEKGNAFATFGPVAENGHWPPHLHFQVIADMEGNKGDYPGVCRFSDKEKYLANCPNPDLILQMMP